jgi:hypothetical protein
LTPQAGIYCAVVTGFLISALGGSKTQIGGPTGAFVVVVAGIVAAHGVDGLFMCTVMAGILLVIMGLAGMGSAVKYIPRPIVIGFTNGIAILISSTQIKDFFGLRIDNVPGVFWLRIETLTSHFGTLNFEPGAGSDCRLVVWNGCGFLFQASGRDYWYALRRYPEWLAAPGHSEVSCEFDSRPARTRCDRGAARGY